MFRGTRHVVGIRLPWPRRRQSKASVPMEKPQGIKPTSPRNCSLPFAARVIRLCSPRNDATSLALNRRTGSGLFIVRRVVGAQLESRQHGSSWQVSQVIKAWPDGWSCQSTSVPYSNRVAFLPGSSPKQNQTTAAQPRCLQHSKQCIRELGITMHELLTLWLIRFGCGWAAKQHCSTRVAQLASQANSGILHSAPCLRLAV
ncbi:uncharacterized protein B0T15DRAFT_233086 [Chaetomium strumarium]|uniref:Uncharacterized protein n=1 Tax=Chaetomium strumarium TaxID=1170767 RepID=A0AAJ0GQU6_9PEZI|nr:hypothetical protein B0T15DRAFT_233086 [Chaetomium strumarium]